MLRPTLSFLEPVTCDPDEPTKIIGRLNERAGSMGGTPGYRTCQLKN